MREPEAVRQEGEEYRQDGLLGPGPTAHMGWEEGVTRGGLDFEKFVVFGFRDFVSIFHLAQAVLSKRTDWSRTQDGSRRSPREKAAAGRSWQG